MTDRRMALALVEILGADGVEAVKVAIEYTNGGNGPVLPEPVAHNLDLMDEAFTTAFFLTLEQAGGDDGQPA